MKVIQLDLTVNWMAQHGGCDVYFKIQHQPYVMNDKELTRHALYVHTHNVQSKNYFYDIH